MGSRRSLGRAPARGLRGSGRASPAPSPTPAPTSPSCDSTAVTPVPPPADAGRHGRARRDGRPDGRARRPRLAGRRAGPPARRRRGRAARSSASASVPSSWPPRSVRQVTRGPAPEFGVGEVHLTEEAIDDPVSRPGADAVALRALARRHLHPARGRGAPGRQRGLREPGLPSWGTAPTGSSSTSRSPAASWRTGAHHLPPGVFVRASDVAHVSRAGEGIVRRFVALAAADRRRPVPDTTP